MATERFVHSNMKLVISRALQHCDPRDPRIIDMISDGSVGLVWAIQRFDLSTPYRFSTYAVWWINSAIKKGLRFFKRHELRIPARLRAEFAKGMKDLIKITNTFPTDTEVAKFIKWDRHTLRLYQKSIIEPPLVVHTIEQNLPGRIPQPQDMAEKNELKELIDSVLHKMSPIEEDIIRRRYGIGCREETLIEIATFYTLARERIRQIETQALRRIFILFTDKGEPCTDMDMPDESEEERKKKNMKAKVVSIIKQLDPVTRDVLTSFYGIGRKKQTIDQIARAYDMPINDVETILENGIDTLDNLMGK